MIVHSFDQYSDEYWALKLARPSASKIQKHVFTSTGKKAAGQEAYMHQLLAEELAGRQLDGYQNDAMRRGLEMEPEAVNCYEFITDQRTEEVGCITNPAISEHLVISPDRWTPANPVPGLEVKCPGHTTQVKYLIDRKCPSEYFPQVQTSMWITEQEHWDFVSYHPDLPPLIVTVNRDQKWIDSFAEELDAFLGRLDKKRQRQAA